MSKQRDKLALWASDMVEDISNPTEDQIREVINQLRASSLFSGISDDDVESIAREIEERIGISMGLGAILESAEFCPWLDDARASGHIKPYYWRRYEKLLRKKRLPPEVVSRTAEITDRILGRLGNPEDVKDWNRLGMVVGHVQSGKTANYIGLACKAADAGYRLIIVIAGIHNNLRNQTQARIDEGFIGRDTSRLQIRKKAGRSKFIGVGCLDKRRMPVSLTNTIKDFNKAMATTNTSQIESYVEPVILVIKKNSSTLKNLIEWLREHSASEQTKMIDQPVLLIDDEADNASINVGYTREEVSKINGQIRSLLNLFRRSSYVGYTATPFANIFIDPDTKHGMRGEDLFPKHFIIGLDPPTNYLGSRRVFIDGMPEEGKPEFVRYIKDNEDIFPIRHKITHDVGELPLSMIGALRAFLVARTIRNLKGQSEQHASMLVNASRFTDVQGKLRNRLHDRLEVIRSAICVEASKGSDALRNPEIAELHKTWTEEYASIYGDWQAIQDGLLSTVRAAKVVLVNRRTNELDYNEATKVGLTVIAIGGFSLSRGLTLEGLTVSYWLRNSMMYDTLMQMGRWFGYRAGYEDLCRIWMPEEAAGWYSHISEATEELYAELKRMEQSKATPEMFGLAVRSHPESLMITARNKIGSGKKFRFSGGLSNKCVETTKVSIKHATLERNRRAARKLIADFAGLKVVFKRGPRGFFVRGVPVQTIDDFLLAFENDSLNTLTQKEPLRKYIAERAVDELAKWDVLIASAHEKKPGWAVDFGGWQIGPVRRRVGAREFKSGHFAFGGAKMRVTSRGVEKAGVDPDVAKKAEADYRIGKEYAEGADINYPDFVYRAGRSRPLLIVYLVRPFLSEDESHVDMWPEEDPVVAWGISFPISEHDETVEYVVNMTKQKEMLGYEDTDEDVNVDDD